MMRRGIEGVSRKFKAAAAKNTIKKAGSLQKRPVHVQLKYTPLPSGPAAQFSLSAPVLSAQQFASGYSIYGKWPGILGAASTTLASPPLQGPSLNCGNVRQITKPIAANLGPRWKVAKLLTTATASQLHLLILYSYKLT